HLGPRLPDSLGHFQFLLGVSQTTYRCQLSIPSGLGASHALLLVARLPAWPFHTHTDYSWRGVAAEQCGMAVQQSTLRFGTGLACRGESPCVRLPVVACATVSPGIPTFELLNFLKGRIA